LKKDSQATETATVSQVVNIARMRKTFAAQSQNAYSQSVKTL